jgi:general nucleoside transport system ATP-binding protein
VQKTGDPVLELEGVCCRGDEGLPALEDVSFCVKAGEIVGVAGVDGNGQKELAEVIHGMRGTTAGTMRLNGHVITGKPPREILKDGLAHIPEDRLACGVVEEFSVEENLALIGCDRPPFAKNGLLSRSSMEKTAEELREQFSIKCANIQEPLRDLSGGNQQKVVLAREILRRPAFLIAAQPSRGLDVGATEYIQKLLIEKRSQGMGILLISSDLDEILAVSDRILVLYEGKIAGEAVPGVTTTVEIGLMMAGASGRRERSGKDA